MKTFIYDLEVFSNYTLAVFYDGKTFYEFTNLQFAQLREFVSKGHVYVGYNNFSYDDIILRYILNKLDVTCLDVFKLSKIMINSKRYPENIWKLQYSKIMWGRSIDMYQMLNKKGSLKEWEAREHMEHIKEANVDFDAPLPLDKFEQTRLYCRNDVVATWNLYTKYIQNIELRTKLQEIYDLNERVYVLSEAGIAQMLFIDKYAQRTGNWSTVARKAAERSDENTTRRWHMAEIISDRVRFITPQFREFHNQIAELNIVAKDEKGQDWEYRNEDGEVIFKNGKGEGVPTDLGCNAYQIGVGGLHSDDAQGRFVATKDVGIYDLDVTSYYPSLMIVENLFPKHLGPAFVRDFTAVRDMRVKAKKEGRKVEAEALKIVANSTFGKFNDIYSPLRSCVNAMRVTINGQLQLLMLVEMLEVMGARVLTANTDGVTFMWHRDQLDKLEVVKTTWEKQTGHTLEQAEYSLYCRRAVNDYIALKTDGSIKYKGCFNPAPRDGKTDERIIKLAAENYLLKGIPLAQTVYHSNDIRDFVFYQRVKNGGDLYLGDDKIGRIARWYRSTTNGKPVHRKDKDGSFTMLPNGENGVLIMDLPDSIPADLDRSYYIDCARQLVESVTKRVPPKKPKKAKV